MKISDKQLDTLLQSADAQALKRALLARDFMPSPPQVSKILGHLASVGSTQPLRLGVVHTYTSELLDPWLHFAAALNDLSVATYHAPYGVTLQEANAASGLVAHQPEVTLLLLKAQDLHPGLRLPPECHATEDRAALLEGALSQLRQLVDAFRSQLGGQIVVTLLPAMHPPGLGWYDAMAEHSAGRWWQSLDSQLAMILRQDFSGVSLLDLREIVSDLGRRRCFDQRLWHTAGFPFSADGALALSNAVMELAASLKQTRTKVIVLDADNTLWGGVVGEDGINGIALGPDYPGSAFVAFQQRILSLQQRGFVLALCSKNNAQDVEEVFSKHPHQLLKNEHFAAARVNWLPKPDNLRSIAEELNLGLDAFIFVDDSDHECAAVRHSLPEVQVVQVPDKALEVPTCLDHLARLQITSLTGEDLAKTAMYAQERQRRSQRADVQASGGSSGDYLKSLNMRMTVGLDDASRLPRLAQLTQKTNQFNLTTHRYSEQDMADKIASEDVWVFHFSLADSFGDSGVVGLAIAERVDDDDSAHLDTFLMSCRVIGRDAEKAFLETVIDALRQRGIATLLASYRPTRKNVIVQTFLPDNGFQICGDNRFSLAINVRAPTLDTPPILIEGPD